MPKNAKKATRSQVPRRSPLPAAGQPAQPEGQEMTGNDRVSDFSSLSPRQPAVLPVVALSSSIAQAACDSGVSESALRRWLDDPTIREAPTRFHREIRSLVQPCLPGPQSADLLGNARKRSEIIGLFEFSERIRRINSLVLPCHPVRNRRICSETLGNNRSI